MKCALTALGVALAIAAAARWRAAGRTRPEAAAASVPSTLALDFAPNPGA